MKYVVTGGAGFIGSHLTEELLAQGHEVIIIDNLFTGKIKNIPTTKNVTFIQGSVMDIQFLKTAFVGVDGVFHLAAVVSVPKSIQNPDFTSMVNIGGTINVLEAARECGVKKVVFASSAAVYGEPKSPYALSKSVGEQYMKLYSGIYGMDTVSLRYYNVYGPRQNNNSDYAAVIPKFINNIKTRQPITIYGDGNQTRDFVSVWDVVQANIKAMASTATGAFDVGYGESISILELANILMDMTGVTVPIIFAPRQPGDIRFSVSDISFTKRDVGYTPEIPLIKGLEVML